METSAPSWRPVNMHRPPTLSVSSSLRHNLSFAKQGLVRPLMDGVDRVYVDAQARPFAKLGPEDLRDTLDVCRLLGCSVRSVYRWVEDRSRYRDGAPGGMKLRTGGYQ